VPAAARGVAGRAIPHRAAVERPLAVGPPHPTARTTPRARRVGGPLVITELSATTVVAPGWAARVLPSGDLLLERRTR
jgi:hypothetical protein